MKQATGNMYSFVTHTWNPIKGKCPHDCFYCYMKKWNLKDPVHLDEKTLLENSYDISSGHPRFIFVGSGTDMFCDEVKAKDIFRVLEKCWEYPNNRYLFQTKNPERFMEFQNSFPPNVVLGTTIESDHYLKEMGESPSTVERSKAMSILSERFITMVTIEPIMKFSMGDSYGINKTDMLLPGHHGLPAFVQYCQPAWVNIGADSKGSKLPEPSSDEIKVLISELEKFTIVRQKDNLKRLLK